VRLAAGIDVGGTKCLGVVVDLDQPDVVRREVRVATPSGEQAILDGLVALADDLGPYDSLGIGLPGLVTRQGILRAAPNLVDVADLPVGPHLAAELGRPVVVQNDATCALAGEWRLGAAAGFDDVLIATLGTGIGGGIVAGGRLQLGANGFAAEIGHMIVDPDGPPCPCGRRGCWERFASGSGMAHLARVAIDAGRLRPSLAGPDGEVRGEDVERAAGDGDAEAVAVIDEWARWLAIGLVSLTNILDPGRIVLGGGLSKNPAVLLPPVQRWFDALLYAPELRPHPSLVFAELGEHAGAIGAALLPTLVLAEPS
jgi:glucokinase